MGSPSLTLARTGLHACDSRGGRIGTIFTVTLATTLLAGPFDRCWRCGSLTAEAWTNSKFGIALCKDLSEGWKIVTGFAFIVNVVDTFINFLAGFACVELQVSPPLRSLTVRMPRLSGL